MKKKIIYCILVLFIIILFFLSLSTYCNLSATNYSYIKENTTKTVVSRDKYSEITCPPFLKNPLNSDSSINYNIVSLYNLPSFSPNNLNSAIGCIKNDSLEYTKFLDMLKSSEDPFERGTYFYLKLSSTYFLSTDTIDIILNDSINDSSPFVHSIVHYWLDINNLINEKKSFIKEIVHKINENYISIILESLESWTPGSPGFDKSELITMIYDHENGEEDIFENFLGEIVKESIFLKEGLVNDFWDREIRDYPNSLALNRLRRTNAANIIYHNIPEEKQRVLSVLTDRSELMSIRRDIFTWYYSEKGKEAFNGDIALYFEKNIDDPMADYYHIYEKGYLKENSWYKKLTNWNCLNLY